MANKYLGRDDAPFGDEIWTRLDDIVVSAAKSQLSARKLLEIEGPFGLELKSMPLLDNPVEENAVRITTSDNLPLPLMETFFTLSSRDLATYSETGFSLDSGAIAQAAINAAMAEDRLIFEGDKKFGIQGLMTTSGVKSVDLGDWNEIGTAANDVIKAVSALDDAGFHGPYLLALSPDLYNKLYRLYPQGYQIELQHIESIVGKKVIKAPGIENGGLLIAEGRRFASIVIGQDMITGFVGPEGSGLRFKISESLVPWIKTPGAICVFKV